NSCACRRRLSPPINGSGASALGYTDEGMPKRRPAIRPEPAGATEVEARPLQDSVESQPVASEAADTPYLVPCLLLFAGSGCAALIYEIVWFQLLELVIGSSGVSLGLLLAAYMGGLC